MNKLKSQCTEIHAFQAEQIQPLNQKGCSQQPAGLDALSSCTRLTFCTYCDTSRSGLALENIWRLRRTKEVVSVRGGRLRWSRSGACSAVDLTTSRLACICSQRDHAVDVDDFLISIKLCLKLILCGGVGDEGGAAAADAEEMLLRQFSRMR